MKIKSIIKEYYEQLFVHKPGEVDQFLKKHKLPKCIKEEIDDVNKPIPIKCIESIIDNFQKQKAQGLHGKMANSIIH